MLLSDSVDLIAVPPVAVSAGDWLEREILSGRLAPGCRLDLAELRARHHWAEAELDHALARLTHMGLVTMEMGGVFRVAPVSLADLMDLTATRIVAEGAALRAAMESGGPEWEEGVRTAYDRLAGLDPLMGQGMTGPALDAWEAANHGFHAALTAACPARRMQDFVGLLYVQHERYRRLSITRPRDRDVAGEHAALFQAALDRDADSATRLLAHHIQATATIAAEGIRDGSWFGHAGDAVKSR